MKAGALGCLSSSENVLCILEAGLGGRNRGSEAIAVRFAATGGQGGGISRGEKSICLETYLMHNSSYVYNV